MKIKYLHFFFKKKNKPPRISLCLILISLFFSAKISAQFAIPLTTGSFTKDVIAENSLGSAYSSAAMDLSNNVFYSSTFPSSSNGISSTSYSYGTHPYVLQPFNGNNVNQILPNGADAILTLQAPTQLTNVFLLVTSTEQISYVDVTVNFTDATSQLITSTSISDWALGSGGQIFSGIVNRGANTFVYPRKVFEIGGSITTLNQNKYVQSIRVKRTGGSTANSRVHIFGASSCSLPVITQCLGNISEACAGVVNYTVAASGATSLSYTKSGATSGSGSGTGSGTSFNFGTTNVIVTATNLCGSVSCSFPVIIVDNQPPTITCPAPLIVNNDASVCNAAVNYPLPSVTDNCNALPPVLVSGLASGSVFPGGISTVTYGAIHKTIYNFENLTPNVPLNGQDNWVCIGSGSPPTPNPNTIIVTIQRYIRRKDRKAHV